MSGHGRLESECAELRQRVAELEAERLANLAEKEPLRERSRADFDAMARLHEVGALFVRENDFEPVLQKIVDTAIALSGANFGTLQLLDPRSGNLRIRAHRGFSTAWLDFWSTVYRGKGACGLAIERGERVIVEDVETSPVFVGTAALEIQREAGVRAVLSTPLLSRSGKPLGAFSTHYRTPNRPQARALHLLDLLARQAADIVERHQTEETLRERERSLAEAQRLGSIGSWEWDVKTGEVHWSQQLYETFGVAPESFGHSVAAFRTFVCPEDLPRVEQQIARAASTGAPIDMEYRIVARDGATRTLLSRGGLAQSDPDGTPRVMLGVAQDITARKTMEAALRENEARFRAIYQNGPLGIAVGDLEGRLILVNPKFCELLGYDEEELIGKSFRSFTVEEDLPTENALVQEMLAGKRSHYNIEKGYVRKDGRRIRVALSTAILRDAAGQPEFGLAMVQDITERARAEEERGRLRDQLLQAQKMESIATLAGGVAHDFNNILGGILSGLSLLEVELDDRRERHQADIHDIMGLVTRGAELARQLLGFSRRGKYEVAPRNVAEIVRKTADLFGRSHREITMELVFAPALDLILVDHTQLEQVLLNLFINSAHAMPDGGRLTVTARNATLAATDFLPPGTRPGRFVRLTVADTGTGIDPAILPRIFDPFFTTKAPGQGSGLGLASVYGIVKNHGGDVTVESTLGRGTTFALVLPSSGERSESPPPKQAAAHPGRGTLLLVDDEQHLLNLLGRMLRAKGYTVLTASRGAAAVELVREHGATISLVLLDLTMPEMSSAATFEAMREIAPTLKVLLVSGFSIEGQAQALLDRGCDGFLQKPFEVAKLLEKLQALLEAPRPPRRE